MYGIDLTYLVFAVPAFLLGIWASSSVKSRFAKFDKVRTKRGVTGAQAAQILLNANGITDVRIAHISGNLTDNYNPQTKVLSLSDSTFSSDSIAAVGVAAHETGHAIQHNVAYAPLEIRRMLVPAANIGSNLGPILALAGIGLGYYSSHSSAFFQILVNIGLILFSLATLFYVVTLPVEFDASRRALKILKSAGVFVDDAELDGAKSVLQAAAMTYVSSALSAIGSFVRIFMMTRRRD